MSKKILSFLLILVVLSTSAFLLLTSISSFSKCPFFECPKDDSYAQTCLDSALPPWPICKLGSVEHWVAKAEDSASRCCGDDLSGCDCPSKDSDAFKAKIGPWCDGVSTCDSNLTEETEAFVEEWFDGDITSES